MEDILRAVVLGIIQGLTEFLPISSSGHLIVIRNLFGWEFSDNITFDVALHLGTTIAVVSFFWRQWIDLSRSGLNWLSRSNNTSAQDRSLQRLLLILILGSIPIAVVGLTCGDFIENSARSPIVVGAMLLVFAVILFFTERIGAQQRNLDSATWKDAIKMGLAQAIALVPGVSRSGVTISIGLSLGFTRAEAARFSFLLATPAIIGVSFLKISEAIAGSIALGDISAMIVGGLTSAVVGWMSIGFLLRLVQSHGYLWFVSYRVIAGIFVLTYFLT